MKTWYLATFKWSDNGVYCTNLVLTDSEEKAEDIGYIFRCLLKDYGYGFTTYSDGEVCKITVEVKDYEEFEMIKVLFDEAKDACRR